MYLDGEGEERGEEREDEEGMMNKRKGTEEKKLGKKNM